MKPLPSDLVHRLNRRRMLFFLPLLLIVTLMEVGCIQSFVMLGKVMMGDPQQTSGFEMVTGVKLSEGEHTILLHVSAPSYVSEDYGTLASDVQLELIRKMKRHGISVKHPDAAADVLDRLGGHFDPQALARELTDVDYIFHISIDHFSHKEEASPNLYRGHAGGRIVGFSTRGEDGQDLKHAVQVFDQGFKSNYPTTHPVPVDQTPKTVFIRRCVDNLADNLGSSFYDQVQATQFSN